MLLTRWFAASERGTYWGLWNISTNLGGFLSPLIVGKWFGATGFSYLHHGIHHLSWQACRYLCGRAVVQLWWSHCRKELQRHVMVHFNAAVVDLNDGQFSILPV
eukprot:GHUV01050336.1.p2 GENE.GHUV01050336.1~~GHUV01050336.1.p2  ORF type:complete len:104 (-),score=12.88 GHUV01050336.1:674-985(-)